MVGAGTSSWAGRAVRRSRSLTRATRPPKPLVRSQEVGDRQEDSEPRLVEPRMIAGWYIARGHADVVWQPPEPGCRSAGRRTAVRRSGGAADQAVLLEYPVDGSARESARRPRPARPARSRPSERHPGGSSGPWESASAPLIWDQDRSPLSAAVADHPVASTPTARSVYRRNCRSCACATGRRACRPRPAPRSGRRPIRRAARSALTSRRSPPTGRPAARRRSSRTDRLGAASSSATAATEARSRAAIGNARHGP